MPRFFITQTPQDGVAVLTGENAHHISKVLRMAPEDEIVLCDGASTEYLCSIAEMTKDTVLCKVLKTQQSAAETRKRISLFMAVPKGDKMDLIIQKCVELGVHEVVPFLSRNCVAKPKDPEKKRQRWQKIADEAAKQCGRGMLPQVQSILSFEQAIAQATQADLPLFPYENEQQTTLRDALEQNNGETISVLIGSEGGFTPAEAAQASQIGLRAVSLGKRILRCETAPIVTLAAILYASGDM